MAAGGTAGSDGDLNIVYFAFVVATGWLVGWLVGWLAGIMVSGWTPGSFKL